MQLTPFEILAAIEISTVVVFGAGLLLVWRRQQAIEQALDAAGEDRADLGEDPRLVEIFASKDDGARRAKGGPR